MPESELVPPVAGLPVGPATWEGVRAQLSVNDDLDDTSLVMVINATNAHVADLPVVVDDLLQRDPVPEAWDLRIVMGATLLAARLFKRRNSPEGVAAMGVEGAVYVQRNDPDISLLLKTGAHKRPAVG